MCRYLTGLLFALRGPWWEVTCGWWGVSEHVQLGWWRQYSCGLLPAGPVTDPVNSVSFVDISSRRIYSAVSVVAILADHWRQFKSGWECDMSRLVVEVRAGGECELVLEVWAGGGGENWWWRWELVWAPSLCVSPLCTPAISAVCDHHLLDSGLLWSEILCMAGNQLC